MIRALESLKNFHFNVLILSKVYIFSSKKVQRTYLLQNWGGIQNLERDRLVFSKLAKGIWQILTWALKSPKHFHFNWLLWAKYILFGLKKYRGVISLETEEGYNIWRGIDWSFQNWHKEFDELWPEHSKVSKIFTLMVSFWANYIFFEIKKSTEELPFITLKSDTKFEEKITCRLENDMRNLANFHQGFWNCQTWNFHGILLSNVENVWA